MVGSAGGPQPLPLLLLFAGNESHSVVSDSCDPMDCSPPRVLFVWNFPGKNTGVDCHFRMHPSSYFLLQAADEPPASEGPKPPTLPLDKNTAANLPQASGEETPHRVPALDSAIQHSSPNVVRKVQLEPAFPDHMGPTASQDPGDLAEDVWAGGGVSLFHPWMLHSPDSCLLS